jgi:hypothetical protein
MGAIRNAVLDALIVLTALGHLCGCRRPSALVEQRNCKQQLRSLWAEIALYRHDHSNQWPPKLDSLDSNVVGRLLRCPGAKRNSTFSQEDYLYIDWSSVGSAPNTPSGKYPLMYDRRTSNHDGCGINILMVDGTIEWDANVVWLRKFASEHPGTRLQMPE